MTDDVALASGLERDAMELTWAAIRLDQARMGRAENPTALVEALECNLQLWVAIKSAVGRSPDMADALRTNLQRLADFVTGRILAEGLAIEDAAVDAIINVNLQVSEGLLDSQR